MEKKIKQHEQIESDVSKFNKAHSGDFIEHDDRSYAFEMQIIEEGQELDPSWQELNDHELKNEILEYINKINNINKDNILIKFDEEQNKLWIRIRLEKIEESSVLNGKDLKNALTEIMDILGKSEIYPLKTVVNDTKRKVNSSSNQCPGHNKMDQVKANAYREWAKMGERFWGSCAPTSEYSKEDGFQLTINDQTKEYEHLEPELSISDNARILQQHLITEMEILIYEHFKNDINEGKVDIGMVKQFFIAFKAAITNQAQVFKATIGKENPEKLMEDAIEALTRVAITDHQTSSLFDQVAIIAEVASVNIFEVNKEQKLGISSKAVELMKELAELYKKTIKDHYTEKNKKAMGITIGEYTHENRINLSNGDMLDPDFIVNVLIAQIHLMPAIKELYDRILGIDIDKMRGADNEIIGSFLQDFLGMDPAPHLMEGKRMMCPMIHADSPNGQIILRESTRTFLEIFMNMGKYINEKFPDAEKTGSKFPPGVDGKSLYMKKNFDGKEVIDDEKWNQARYPTTPHPKSPEDS